MKDLKNLDKKNLEDILTLTPLQEGMLFHYLTAPATDQYIEQLNLEISGHIDVKFFEKAWNVVVAANEVLRTVFRWEKLKHPIQIVLRKNHLSPLYHDLSDLEFSEKKIVTKEIKINDREKKFDLREIPFRVTLCKIEPAKYLMIVSNHHILYDGWSNGIILKEFFNAYNDLVHQRTPIQPVKNRFKEFVNWLKNQDKNNQEKFWRSYLQGLEGTTELSIKTKTGVKKDTHYTGKYHIRLSQHTKNRLEKFIKTHQITLAAILYCAWGILLQKYNNSSDVLFGTIVSGRSPKLDGIENMVGLFINTLPLRVKRNPPEIVIDMINQVNHILQNREEYETTSLVDISEYTQSGNAGKLFDSIIVIENYPLQRHLMNRASELSIDSYSIVENTNYDLTVAIMVFDGIEIDFVYNRECLEPGAIKNLSGHFWRIIENIIKGSSQQVHKIDILSDQEKLELLVNFNDTAVDYPRDEKIHQLFAEQVERTPDHIALYGCMNAWMHEEGHITYRELNKKANQLASILKEKGVNSDTIVGIMLPRTIEVITGILGILKADAAYLPIDAAYPEERINYMLKDSKVKVFLTIPKLQVKIKVEVEAYPGQPQELPLQFINIEKDLASASEPSLLTLTPTCQVSSTNLAYIIYTSGTAGQPKGVMIQHNCLFNQVIGLTKKFDFNAALNYILLTRFTFDVSVMHIFLSLTTGAKLFLASDEIIKDPVIFWQSLNKWKIDLINVVPSLLKILLENNKDQKIQVKYLFVGGEVFDKELYNSIKGTFSAHQIINIYGPTEATINATLYHCKSKERLGAIPIGRPLINYRVYILDNDLNLVPIGVKGELCISGKGIARGYLNRPELTAEKFNQDLGDYLNYREKKKKIRGKNRIHSYNHLAMNSRDHASVQYHSSTPQYPITPLPHSPIYRTGDLARWLPDGNIEFLGRIDHQVKLRGFRIELGEIENQLLKRDEVKEVIVLAKEDSTGEGFLCAYIVSGEVTLDHSGLQNYLAGVLPDFMVPSYFVQLNKIPLTSNGKLDRRALPEPGIKIKKDKVLPRNEIEKKLAEIWTGVLGLSAGYPLGIDDNFFKLGGQSLKAMTLTSRISRTFNIDIRVNEVFENPTILSLANFIKKARKNIYEEIKFVEKKEYYPLSSAQQRLFFLNQLGNTGTTYNMPAFVTHQGSVDKTRIVNAIETLIKRHESLRTSFEFVDNIPAQHIHDDVKFQIDYYDMKEVEKEDRTTDDRQGTHPSSEFIRPFDLTRPPLLRVGLVEISTLENLLLFDMHHIISDGASTAILLREFTSLYAGERLSVLKIQYKDFCLWQKNKLETGAIRSQENYWLSQYKGERPGLNLPTDYPRPQVMTFEGDKYEFKLGPGETLRLNALASTPDVTLFMNLMALFNVLLYKYSGQEDIIVGSGLSGRTHADLQATIGMFVNVLPMRHHPGGEKTYLELLAEVKESGIKAHENQDFPFEELVDKLKPGIDLSRNPLFDVCLVLQNFDTPIERSIKFIIKTENIYHKVSRFDLTLFAMEQGNELFFQVEYSTKLFKPTTIQRLADHFLNIIRQVSVNPGILISDLDILTTTEKQHLLIDFNDTATFYPRDRTIHQFFEEQAEQRPDHIALVGANELYEEAKTSVAPLFITYRELNKKSDQLAHLLIEKGVKPDRFVGIMVERSTTMIIGIMGILKSGGAYLPIDPAHPKYRIDYILSDSNVGVLLTPSKLQDKVKTGGEDHSRQPQQQPLQLIHLEPGFVSAFNPRPSTSTCRVSPTNLAYTLYTSGSSGRPKGVLVEHDSLINVLTALNKYYPFDETCVYLMKTSYEFDVSAAELFGWFLGGGKLVLLQKYGEKDLQKILAAIARYGITHINFVPSMFRAFIDSLNRENIINISRLRYIFLAGEALPGELVRRFTKLSPGIRLENIYGPTEATIYASKYSLLEWQGGDSMPIGKPLPNVILYICDSYGHWQGIGIPGELCIAGAGLARGYLNKPELTAQKFPSVPFGFYRSYMSYIPKKIYKTGDLARWLPDGNIEYLGRMDNQVKIRGFRIETGEIERQLLTHHEISDAIVVARQDQSGGQGYLCAYFVPLGGLSGDGLREHLAAALPAYMIPSYFVKLDKIPLTPSGKVDRKSLPVPGAFQRHSKTVYVPCASETEQLIEGIWKYLLKLEKIGIDDNFFDIGGNSINVLQVNNRLNDVFRSKLTVIQMFRYTTIRSLAQFLNQQGIKQDINRKKFTDTFKKSKIDIKQIYQKRMRKQNH